MLVCAVCYCAVCMYLTLCGLRMWSDAASMQAFHYDRRRCPRTLSPLLRGPLSPGCTAECFLCCGAPVRAPGEEHLLVAIPLDSIVNVSSALLLSASPHFACTWV